MTLEIGAGGAVAVDPDTLREAAARLIEARGWMESAQNGAAAAAARVRALPLLTVDGWGLPALQQRIAALGPGIDELLGRIRTAADAYELVELRVAAELLSGRSTGVDAERERRRIDERIAALEEANPEARERADELLREWRAAYGDEFAAQWVASLLPLVAVAPGAVTAGGVLPQVLRQRVLGLGRGVILDGARLSGAADPVRVEQTWSGTAAAPDGLAAAARRIPGGGDARVRVERYTMPDGTRQFAVYLAGTHGAGDDAWDWSSNLQLYMGERSSSFQATVDALARAGARPGDVLHTFGFSQGAMIGARLATEGGFDVRTNVGFGPPVAAQTGPETLSVTVRHDDDPVALLAGGGLPGGAGGPDSFVAERTYDPGVGLGDLVAPAHRLDAYAETAAMVDASDDPRVGALHDALAELSGAVDVEVSEYSATREETE